MRAMPQTREETMSDSSNYCGKCKNVISTTDTICTNCGSLISEVGMGCTIHHVPTAAITSEALVPSMTAIQKGKDGNEKTISYVDEKLSTTAKFQDGICEESSEMGSNNANQKRDKKKEDAGVVGRLLPFLNNENNSHFTISDEIPDENSMDDVLIEELDSGNKLGIQITVSDGKALESLHKKRSLNRSGDEGIIFDGNIKQAIEKKGECKYPAHDREKRILALKGWPSVTKTMLEGFKEREKDSLKQAGYYQIWFVGIVDEYILRLY